MAIYDAMKFEIVSKKELRNRFDDLADALRALQDGNCIRVEYDPEIQRSTQRNAIKTAMLLRGIVINSSLEEDGIRTEPRSVRGGTNE